MIELKEKLKRVPIIGSWIQRMYRQFAGASTFNSREYWERRYATGGTSGSGSYGRLAVFKAQVVNDFIEKYRIQNVIEFGCGDGHQLSLAKYPHYIGLDVSETAIARCQEIFKHDSSKQFYTVAAARKLKLKADLTISLDVIFHLTEDDVFESYMRQLFNSSTRYVVIYSSNEDGMQVNHELTRNHTRWIEANMRDWQMQQKISNPYPYDPSNPDETSQSDFYIYHKHDL